MQRVHFVAPAHVSDLRTVLCQHTAEDRGMHQLTYTTQYGETRVIRWLTQDDAQRRAAILKRRGYIIAVSRLA